MEVSLEYIIKLYEPAKNNGTLGTWASIAVDVLKQADTHIKNLERQIASAEEE